MGNVLALGPQTLPPAPPITAGTPSSTKQPVTREADSPAQAVPDSVIKEQPQPPDAHDHPGTFEELHKKCKDVMPVNFDGIKLLVNKGLSNHFQISHTITMSALQPSGYRFGATYVGTKQYSPTEAFPILLGDIDPSGDMNANIIHKFTPNIQCKFAAQIQKSKFAASQLTTDYRGSDFTASVTVGNLDVINQSGVGVIHYMQAVTQRLALGAEYAYQQGVQVPGGRIGVLSIGGKYAGDNYVASAQIGSAGLHACYWHKGKEQVQVGVELETNFRLKESVATIGYQVDVPKANLVFRGMLDSNLMVGAVLEKKLPPLPFTFAISALVNHQKNATRVGAGLILG